MESVRNSFDKIKANGKKIVFDTDYRENYRRNQRNAMFIRNKFRDESFIAVIDSLLDCLNKIDKVYTNMSDTFSFRSDLNASLETTDENAKKLLQKYPECSS